MTHVSDKHTLVSRILTSNNQTAQKTPLFESKVAFNINMEISKMAADLWPIDWHLIWPVRSFYACPAASNSQRVPGKDIQPLDCNFITFYAVCSSCRQLFFSIVLYSKWVSFELTLSWNRIGIHEAPEIKVGKCFSINLDIFTITRATTRVKGCTSFLEDNQECVWVLSDQIWWTDRRQTSSQQARFTANMTDSVSITGVTDKVYQCLTQASQCATTAGRPGPTSEVSPVFAVKLTNNFWSRTRGNGTVLSGSVVLLQPGPARTLTQRQLKEFLKIRAIIWLKPTDKKTSITWNLSCWKSRLWTVLQRPDIWTGSKLLLKRSKCKHRLIKCSSVCRRSDTEPPQSYINLGRNR